MTTVSSVARPIFLTILETGRTNMNTILFIEGDSPSTDAEREYLRDKGFQIDVECDVGEGLALLQHKDYDIILLGSRFDGVDGSLACGEFRKATDAPILITSDREDDMDMIRCFAAGADDYLARPYTPGQLMARMAAHLAKHQRYRTNSVQENAVSPDLVCGDIRIQTGERRVYVGEREVELKYKEYELLIFLANHPDIVFDKETLYQRIWGMDALGDNATVYVHISRLREKIEQDPANPYHIRTVRGAGYRFQC